MEQYQYGSRFDNFLVDLCIGPAEEINKQLFGGDPVFTYKRGATISADVLTAETFGCMVWIEEFDGSPAAIASLFHELVHASMVRYANGGVLRRRPNKEDCKKGLCAIDELMANSVSVLGEAFLVQLKEKMAAAAGH